MTSDSVNGKRLLGRPSSYQPIYAEKARKLCLIGATDAEIADLIGIDIATFYRWRNSFPDFCDALKMGKEHSDERIKRRLYDRALGYSTQEQQVVKIKNELGIEEIKIVTIEKQHPADPTSMIFWLKNRRPDEWREKHSTEYLGSDGNPVDLPSKIEIVSPLSEKKQDKEDKE